MVMVEPPLTILPALMFWKAARKVAVISIPG